MVNHNIHACYILTCQLLFFGTFLSHPYVTVERDASGIWWFAQNGKHKLSIGMNHVNNGGLDDGVGGRESIQCINRTGNPLCGDTLSFSVDGSSAPYFNNTIKKWGSEEAWSTGTINRLHNWGFNTVGGWSNKLAERAAADKGLWYVHLLDIGTTWLNHGGLDFDVWSTEFLDQADAVARASVLPRCNDTSLLGYSLDNELAWGSESLSLNGYLKLPSDSPGGKIARDFVAQHGKGHNASIAFLGLIATQYFSETSKAIRRYDSYHLNLGLRGMNLAAELVAPIPTLGFKHLNAVVQAQLPFVDVLDWHGYLDTPDGGYCGSPPFLFLNVLEELYAASGHTKPILVGEFSFTASDSGMPNQKGARSCPTPPTCLPGCPYATQRERTDAFDRYIKALVVRPFIVGYHVWQWVDEPKIGRWPDGEDSNYGMVDITDMEYPLLAEQWNTTNTEAHNIHGNNHIAL